MVLTALSSHVKIWKNDPAFGHAMKALSSLPLCYLLWPGLTCNVVQIFNTNVNTRYGRQKRLEVSQTITDAAFCRNSKLMEKKMMHFFS